VVHGADSLKGTMHGELIHPKPEALLPKDSRYRRVRAGGRSWLGRSSYWLGSDHLLLVLVEHYSESYRRYFYREIQAVVVRRTKAWEWLMGLGVLGLLLTGAPALFLGSGPGAADPGRVVLAWVFGGVAMLVLAAVLAHGFHGPTCEVTICTAVQRRSLPGIRRLRQAKRFVTEVRDAIEAEVARVRSGPLREGAEPRSETGSTTGLGGGE
jgi:hypothetical protein